MHDMINLCVLQPSLKSDLSDMDKACAPETTLARVLHKLHELGRDILAENRRVDVGRLGIPVYLSMVGEQAAKYMPVRKQMGKGHSEEQAQSSAVMELIERYSFFSFWAELKGAERCTYAQAKEKYGDKLLDFKLILKSTHENFSGEQLELAQRIFNLLEWTFYPVLRLDNQEQVWVPLDWFKLLNEFNGSAAGNTDTEAVLQGLCELVERHVCGEITAEHAKDFNKRWPTIDPASVSDPIVQELLDKFSKNKIQIILKDFSQHMPVATVGVIAWDPSTFPAHSEIVFTAGTATSPAKAAIRAITEIAQLGGDFCTNSCYESSGLNKYTQLEDINWLIQGESTALSSLPDISNQDMLTEVKSLAKQLAVQGIQVFATKTTNPELDIPACYCFGAGFKFKERDALACLGLYVGRRLTEEASPQNAWLGLNLIEELYPDEVFMPFFHGLMHMRQNEASKARIKFKQALAKPMDEENHALIAYYGAYSHTQCEEWDEAVIWLDQAVKFSPYFAEAASLRGICYFKLENYQAAKDDFALALRINKGSAGDLANLGACYMELEDKVQAKAYLKAALEIDPSLIKAKERLASL